MVTSHSATGLAQPTAIANGCRQWKGYGNRPGLSERKVTVLPSRCPGCSGGLCDYLGEVRRDAGLGVLIEELKRIGAYENTILVVVVTMAFPESPAVNVAL